MNESTPFADCEHIELHRLEPAFVDRRIQAPQSVRQLMLSIDRDGQRAPLIALDAGGPLVLIDGYRRWEALQRLGRDTGLLERWRCSLAEALAQVLLRHQGRTFEPIEQAWLLAAAQDEGMTQRDLAGALGKDPSWVTRRLALLRELSEPFQQAVRQGVLSSWAASRILVPLARATPPTPSAYSCSCAASRSAPGS